MQRAQAITPRLVLERHPPLVPCAYAEGRKDRWTGRILSCGAMVPHKPRWPCPNCGQVLIAAHAPAPGPDSRILTGSTAIVDAETGEVAALHLICASDLATRLAAAFKLVYFDTQIFSQVTTTARLNGMAVTHRTFGYAPPQPMRRRYACSRSQFLHWPPVAARSPCHTKRQRPPAAQDGSAPCGGSSCRRCVSRSSRCG